MGTAAKAMVKKERSPDLSLAIAVSLMEVHQDSVLCWPNLSPWSLRNAEPLSSSSFPWQPLGEARATLTQRNR